MPIFQKKPANQPHKEGKDGRQSEQFRTQAQAQTQTPFNPSSSDKERSVLLIQNIYMKDLSFKAPNAPYIFREVWKPKVDLNVNISSQVLLEAEHVYEVVLDATISVKTGEEEEKEAFTVHIAQAGAFTIKVENDEMLKKVLEITCPTLLYPYIQELLGSMANRGSFPKVMLPAFISFDALYEKSQEKNKE